MERMGLQCPRTVVQMTLDIWPLQTTGAEFYSCSPFQYTASSVNIDYLRVRGTSYFFRSWGLISSSLMISVSNMGCIALSFLDCFCVQVGKIRFST